LCSLLHSPVTSSLLGPNIPLSTLFSNTLSLRSSLSVRDQVSHPYEDLLTFCFCQPLKFVIKALLCNIQYLCAFDSDVQLNIHRMHCCVSTTTMVTRVRHNVTLYVHCLSCFKCYYRLFYNRLYMHRNCVHLCLYLSEHALSHSNCRLE
jgi:hypothetical protein